ncbi:MAG: YkgJ family cysteine cluster protein [Pseudomonadota bacterium]
MPVRYDCAKCPAYCCSYARIPVTDDDVIRLARHHKIKPNEARKQFTKRGTEPGERVLRHRADKHYDTACRFLDQETRNCTIYEARPEICRDFPDTAHCGYYEFLRFERRTQDDPDWVATTGK